MMAIEEMKDGLVSEAAVTEAEFEDLYRSASHMWINSDVAEEAGLNGFVSCGIRIIPDDTGAHEMVCVKTCSDETTFSCNQTSGDNDRASGWFVAMNKEQALGVAKKLIELAQEID